MIFMAYGKQYLHLTRRSARWMVLPPPFISLRLCHIVCLTGWFIVWGSEPQYLIDITALIPMNSQDFKQYSNLYSRYLSPPCAEIRPTARQNQPRAVVRNYNNNNNETQGKHSSTPFYCQLLFLILEVLADARAHRESISQTSYCHSASAGRERQHCFLC